jgi:EAL domain-containing protein (putative c-di-GMP-specific phosphodiesterase class I)
VAFRHVICGVSALTTALLAHSNNRKHANDIITALNEERFTIWHQPIVSATTGDPVMYESLLRMKSADGEILPAAHLVPIAEKLGFMQMIDAMVCQTSLKLLAARADTKVSFNLSDSTLRNSYAASRILSIVAEAGKPRSGFAWR